MKTTRTNSAYCKACNQNSSSRKYIAGQGLTEYLIIIMVVVIAGVGAASFFGDSVKASFMALGSELTGGERVDAAEETRTSFDKAKRDVNTQTTLRNYRD